MLLCGAKVRSSIFPSINISPFKAYKRSKHLAYKRTVDFIQEEYNSWT